MITLIGCLDMGNGIGKGGGLLFNIKKDMAHFKKYTKGKIVVMGRNTWESIPEKNRPLKNRENYILTTDKNYKANNANVIHSISDVIGLSTDDNEVIIIGGQILYSHMIEYCEKMVLTHVHAIDPFADKFFPQYEMRDWKVLKMDKHEATSNFPSFTIAEYNRK